MAKNYPGQWSSTAAGNTDIGGIDINEDCNPKNINNAIREQMAQTRLYLNDQKGGNTTGGSGSAYTLSLSSTTAVAAYTDIANLVVNFHTANTSSAPTLAINGITSPPTLKDRTGAALISGQVVGRHVVANSTAGMIIATHQTTTTGLQTLGSGQIKFPATQNPSADPNTLDDYEEGTWTPAITFATAGDLSVAYTTREGVYTKIGRVVYVHGYVQTSSFTHTTASGSFLLGGLPFNSANRFHSLSAIFQGYTKANYTQVQAATSGTSTNLIFLAQGSGQSQAALAAADVPTAGSLIIYASGWYTV